jgi:hypothetical protein
MDAILLSVQLLTVSASYCFVVFVNASIVRMMGFP